jgi:hypothetical protein
MSFQENFERFRELVLQDLSLQMRLREITERALFIQKVVELGGEKGFQFSPETVEEAMRANRRAWLEKWI